jgi:chemotaxis protein MotA
MDLATLVGIAVALGAVVAGHTLEGGHMGSILQPTAAIIVLGGTFGAVAVTFPGAYLRRAITDLRQVIMPSTLDTAGAVKTILAMANKARREGLVSIEKDAEAIKDPFLRGAFELAIDGTEVKTLRAALELEISRHEESGEAASKVFEAAGGYSPTIGILGAVLGLIHVMENLSDPGKLGGGIAVAFVATVYGVGTANLLFLPMAGKLKTRHREQILMMELVVEGVCAIAEGENPRLIERKLSVYEQERRAGKSRGGKA